MMKLKIVRSEKEYNDFLSNEWIAIFKTSFCTVEQSALCQDGFICFIEYTERESK